ncbi:L-threonine 3-dehydrogenase [Clostridioides difficile]|nr:L-threonine 3-dehydrogenase [uncultured Clostridioides sp.]EGT5420539.1 L-threonine 3-dehydrogenase [Clostridioides difficile]MBH7487308.1 L-threonine 3-dehydrogenase [Clostridioides difficile]MBY1673030.1 L-threonine 3-dehydrogenase [Clostridioides difficile]MBY1795319.1 L-threonine 3-dehydrogenase [Clostridioides difficile]MBY1996579.1 L-threonine 3-dehydrogenase [Clostridioides difficile]
MKKILITGALGQIGSELTIKLRNEYGEQNVIASSRKVKEGNPVCESGIFEILDVTDKNRFFEIAKKYDVDTIIHLASLLSAVAESKPLEAWNLNMNGLINGLEIAKELDCKFFTPSSIAAFGENSPKNMTPQDTLQRPNTMYGVTKVSGELLCDYYHSKFGVDTRGVRFPGLISYVTPPGGGTTDYAVDIYYEALKNKRYKSYIAEGTKMDMMYMPDALQSIVDLIEAPADKLIHRNAFNITAMSFSPEEIADSIKKYIPDFVIEYDVDPVRQSIADSWPNSLDSSSAAKEWNFKFSYDLDKMTKDMLEKLSEKGIGK